MQWARAPQWRRGLTASRSNRFAASSTPNFDAAMEARPYGLAKLGSPIELRTGGRCRNGGEALRPREGGRSSRTGRASKTCRNGGEALRPREVALRLRGAPPLHLAAMEARPYGLAKWHAHHDPRRRQRSPQWRRGLTASRRCPPSAVHTTSQLKPQWRRGLTASRSAGGPPHYRNVERCRNGGEALRPREGLRVSFLNNLTFHCRNGGEALRPREDERYGMEGLLNAPQWRRGLTASRRDRTASLCEQLPQAAMEARPYGLAKLCSPCHCSLAVDGPQWRRGLTASRSQRSARLWHSSRCRNGGEALRPREGSGGYHDPRPRRRRNGGEALRPREVVIAKRKEIG